MSNQTGNKGQGTGCNVNARRAFTLIETLVAVSILLVSLAGPLSIAVQSLNSAFYARDQVTAFYLAQEAVEYVRARRDQNYLAGTNWLNGLDECRGASCTVNFPDFTHDACSGACSPVLLNGTTGLYGDNAGDPTIYTRALAIEDVPGTDDEKTIRVTVSWQSNRINRQFTITEQLFDWLQL